MHHKVHWWRQGVANGGLARATLPATPITSVCICGDDQLGICCGNPIFNKDPSDTMQPHNKIEVGSSLIFQVIQLTIQTDQQTEDISNSIVW